MFLLVRATNLTVDGDAVTFRGKAPVIDGRIREAWFLKPRVRRHLERRIMLGWERGRVRLPNGAILAWKLRRDWE
jgi:hypothetical protein